MPLNCCCTQQLTNYKSVINLIFEQLICVELTVFKGCLFKLLATMRLPPAMPPMLLAAPLLVMTRPELIPPGIDMDGLFPAMLIDDCRLLIEFAMDIWLFASELAMLLVKLPRLTTICGSTTFLETDTFGGDCMFGLLFPSAPAAIANEFATKFLLLC